MQIYPAIDIINGECVRLKQGSFDDVTIYEKNPVLVAKKWVDAGASYLHIVDLDGAKQGVSVNGGIIKSIVDEYKIPVQTGGGIRTLKDIEEKINLGVSRVILGTVAINQPEIVKKAVETFGDKIAVGIDAKDGYVAVDGWEVVSKIKALDLCLKMVDVGVKTIIYTDISKDGMLCGTNVAATKEIIDNTDIDIIASGGVFSINDVLDVKKINAHGVIIGKALYEGNIDLREVINLVK